MKKLMLSLILGIMLIGMGGFALAFDSSNCTDTDDGDDIYVSGTLSVETEDGIVTRGDSCSIDIDPSSTGWVYQDVDNCSGDDCYVQEGYCEQFDVEGDYFKPFLCPNGCSAGACITITDNEENETENEDDDEDENETDDDEERRREGLGRIIRGRVKAGIYTNEDGDEIRVRELAQGRFEFVFGNYSARTELEIETETENGRTKFKVKLRGGRNAIIKIMPNVASATALARLRLKVCNTTRDCSIELKEVGEGNRTRLVYEARARKTFKIFGLFKAQREVRTRIDAETGEVVETKRPWWAWLASESDEADELEEQ